MNSVLLLLTAYFLVVESIFETFNFVIPAQKRECFYEELKSQSPAQNIEAFVLSGGSLDILFTIHGPLKYEEVINVSNME